jgi:hypothetical protein
MAEVGSAIAKGETELSGGESDVVEEGGGQNW